jgi:hypothetical protein
MLPSDDCRTCPCLPPSTNLCPAAAAQSVPQHCTRAHLTCFLPAWLTQSLCHPGQPQPFTGIASDGQAPPEKVTTDRGLHASKRRPRLPVGSLCTAGCIYTWAWGRVIREKGGRTRGRCARGAGWEGRALRLQWARGCRRQGGLPGDSNAGCKLHCGRACGRTRFFLGESRSKPQRSIGTPRAPRRGAADAGAGEKG